MIRRLSSADLIPAGPGNFLEATKLISLLLKDDGGPAFDVVAPSLPNYGFSQGVQKVFAEQYTECYCS